MADLEVRSADSSDAEALMRLVNLAFRAERPFVEGDRLDLMEVRARLTHGTFLIAGDPEHPAGCVHVEVKRDRGHIGLLSVDPAQQQHGLGKRLMSAAEDNLRAAGCKTADLRFINHRTELLRFYSELGYVESGTAAFPITARMKMPFHFIEMTKTL
jgi:GNAT superfamily N-acetyltransferase